MSKLLYAGFYRLRKDKVFFGCLLIPPIYSVYVLVSQYMQMKESGGHYAVDSLLFHFLLLMGMLTSVFVSLYVGTEYHDGTIRNKLIGGSSRNSIYLSNLVICCLVGTLNVLLTYSINFAIGLSLFGPVEMSAAKLIQTCIAGILLTLSYISIFHVISMLSSDKTISAVSCILLAVFLIVLAVGLFSKLIQPEFIEQPIAGTEMALETVKNPAYLTGSVRSVYQNMLDFLPAGQSIQILNSENTNLGRMILYSLFIVIGTNIIGLGIFKRKDIK